MPTVPNSLPSEFIRHGNNIYARPDIGGTIPVEIAAPAQHGGGSVASGSSGQNHGEIAGVLRRNQACLACRRRKLKCDAQRPHCSTCVRSYKHLMRTAPRSNPVLTCEYDDGNPAGHEGDEHQSVSEEMGDCDEEGDVTRKKKKKSLTGEPKRKRKDVEDSEAESLRKKIEELELQLAQTKSGPTNPPQKTTSGRDGSWLGGESSAPSPTAFLEMLSSAATAQIPEPNGVPGLRSGVPEHTMMGDSSFSASTGLTPFILPNDWATSMDEKTTPTLERQQTIDSNASATSESRRPSEPATEPSPFTSASGSGVSSLSPNAVFNFSPGPTQPPFQQVVGNSSSWFIANANIATNNNSSKEDLRPNLDADGNLEPATAPDGPWRAVETVETAFIQTINSVPIDSNQGEADGIDAGLAMDPELQQQLLMDLFWPGWPPNLPEPNIVNDLVEAFFDLVPNIPRVLHRARFLARLALPPTHANFPHPALIHAVCSAAAAWCHPDVYSRSAAAKQMYMSAEGKQVNSLSFGLRQAAYGKEAVQDGLNTGNRLFDVVRAMIILSRVFIDDTRMLECWAYCGLVARMILPLGLNVRSAELSLKSVMLPPPVDALEREERRVAVWMGFYHDTVASAASGWGTSFALDELTVPLPVSRKDFDFGAEIMEPNSQDIESPDFWTKHPVPDSFVMVIKAAVIMNRVTRFVRKWKNRHLRDDDDLDGLQRPEFRELANAIACFQMSFPGNLRNPCVLDARRRLDIDLICAHMLPHAAIICLYEPFADISDASDSSARRILGAAQAIVSIVQQLASVVNDGAQNFTSIMHSSASVCLVTAARTCLLFYRFALNVSDFATAESHRMDIDLVRMALGQFGARFKIGHHHAQLIEYFMDRTANPTMEKLQAHYPEHPRGGAPELHPNANFGECILNALNVKRGFWAANVRLGASSPSPFGSTPESATNPNSRGSRAQSVHSASGASNDLRGADIEKTWQRPWGFKKTATESPSSEEPALCASIRQSSTSSNTSPLSRVQVTPDGGVEGQAQTQQQTGYNSSGAGGAGSGGGDGGIKADSGQSGVSTLTKEAEDAFEARSRVVDGQRMGMFAQLPRS
ncbi:hypothetical protein BCR39DRAFT_523592 [Naematelia encephala]|uniref:Zn(2)-C6 fungal-type domain-containing protein n=1 Tax=Naematelia encephala TaxID=71784 RepID=A0A1Y2BDV9_9TREE|nr:hypothetical protein BCR39DRAFT_523592 [Naematelia encephala]